MGALPGNCSYMAKTTMGKGRDRTPILFWNLWGTHRGSHRDKLSG